MGDGEQEEEQSEEGGESAVIGGYSSGREREMADSSGVDGRSGTNGNNEKGEKPEVKDSPLIPAFKFKKDQYIAKVLLAFVLLFVFGAIFTLALENLPRFLFSIDFTI
ncbi:hypothetical protein L2E82_04432 [Cichorium intybus]|uniref:Uncharacterized protein n=1 Tax=Cichorium intybus TaxID=13427 RepID=A0ACB9H5F2_CICIN|nr:hypothetical protein L2E82_04432 [Cichorium intybus]